MWLLLGIIASAVVSLCWFTRATHFYPRPWEIAALYVKLLLSPLYKTPFYQAKISPQLRLNPNLKFELPFKADEETVKRFKEVCEVEWRPDELPPLYPATVFLYPTACLLSQRRYLFPVLGGIHVRNTFSSAHLPANQTYQARLKVEEEIKLVKRGVEICFPQTLMQSGKVVWLSVTTILLPTRHRYAKRDEQVPGEHLTLAEELQREGLQPVLAREGGFSTDRSTGYRYAKVVNDWNPIHLTSLTARLFGFRSAIAHGMYVCTRVFHEMLNVWSDELKQDFPIQFETKFIRPVYLGGRIKWSIYRTQEAGRSPRLHVSVCDAANEAIVHLRASLEGGKSE